VALVVSLTGVAPADDYVLFESVRLYPGNAPHWIEPAQFAQQEVRAATRYQTSFPYGAPRSSNTEQGAVSDVLRNTNVNWAIAIPIKFSPAMVIPPQFMFQSPTSGTESRLLNKDTGLNVNGLAVDISERGAVITNNAVLTAGHRLLCQWTAQIIF